MARSLANTITFGLFAPKRPPGPSFFELQDEPLEEDAYSSLDYPLKLSQKYGDFCYISNADQYIVTGPEGFQHILKTNMHNYIKKNFYYNRIRFLFGHSLLTGDGDYWKQRRKIAQPAFQTSMMKHYVPSILQGTQNFIEGYQAKFSNALSPRQPAPQTMVNVLTLMNHLTLDIALVLFTGSSLPEVTRKKLSKAIYYANYYVTHSFFISPWKPTPGNLRFYWHMNTLNQILLDCIRSKRQRLASEKQSPENALYLAHEKQSPENDLLTSLILAKNQANTGPLTDQEILDEFKTLLLTGHETTGALLTWMWYLLADNPEWRDALEQELAAVLMGRLPTLEDLMHLPILTAIVQETLRLYPPIWSFARCNREPDHLYGYTLPKNSLIVLNLYALHRNPRYWEKPNEFHPSRFLGDNAKNIVPYSFLPFSTGPRTCIASHLGMQEALLIAASLAQYFRFDKCPKTRLRLEPCISLRPKQGLLLNITSR